MSNNGSDSVSAYKINSTSGVLTVVSGSPFSTGTGPQYLVVDPTSNFLYIANTDDNSISAYKIDGTTGALTAVSGSAFLAGTAPDQLVVDPTGKFLYVANYGFR